MFRGSGQILRRAWPHPLRPGGMATAEALEAFDQVGAMTWRLINRPNRPSHFHES
jgi:hypothetical protein